MASNRSGDQIRNQPGTSASKKAATKDRLMAMSVGMFRSFIRREYHRGCSVPIHECERQGVVLACFRAWWPWN